MTATVYNFTGDDRIEKGATLRRVFTWLDSSNVPVDLTGRSARMMIRKTLTTSPPLAILTTENGGIELGGALGTVTVKLTAQQTSAIAAETGVYDLEIEDADGFVHRLLKGEVELDPEATRP